MPASDLSEKQLMMITVGVAGALVVVLGVGLYIGYREYEKAKDERVQEEKEVKRLEGVVATLDDKERELETAKKKAQKIFDLLPDEADVSGLMKEIIAKSRGTGLKVNEVKLDKKAGRAPMRIRGKQRPQDPKTKIAYDWKLRGSFHEIAKFVNQVEDDMNRFLAIEELSIEARDRGLVPGAKGKKGHAVEMRMITYFYTEQRQP